MMFRLKKLLFVFIIVVVTLPLIQHYFAIIKEPPLNGVFKKTPKPQNKDWFNTSYQDAYEKYYNDTVGFKPFFVRYYNQIQYSLFNKTAAKDVEIGKENYLFEGGYIRDYMGYNFVGKQKIKDKVGELKIIQEQLKEDSILFLLILAPGKASFYPEYLPKRYDTNNRQTSNYQYYSYECRKQQLNLIDMNGLFVELKDKTKRKLYPKGGIHWGEYGVALALDTLAKYIEKQKQINMLDFNYNNVSYEEKIRKKDKDLSELMNLCFEFDAYPMPKPNYIFKHKKCESKPNLLIIGDSYASRLIETNLIDSLFNNYQLWYYNRGVEPPKQNSTNQVKDLIVKDEIAKYDVVVLLSTESNLYKFDFGFVDGYYRDKVVQKDYNYYLKRIANDKEWNSNIIRKAKEMNVSYKTILSKEAKVWADKAK